MKLFEVVAKCGHVGRNNYVLKTFAVCAEDGKEAASKTRGFPRVKHHHKDAIRSVHKIDSNSFNEIIISNQSDPYFRCRCIQDYKRANCQDMIYMEKWVTEMDCSPKSMPNKSVFYGKMKIRNPKRFIRNYTTYDEADCISYDDGYTDEYLQETQYEMSYIN